jgi:hypothetical protein
MTTPWRRLQTGGYDPTECVTPLLATRTVFHEFRYFS